VKRLRSTPGPEQLYTRTALAMRPPKAGIGDLEPTAEDRKRAAEARLGRTPLVWSSSVRLRSRGARSARGSCRGRGSCLVAKCSAIAASGNPCKGVPVDGSQWCYHHHPDNEHKLHTRGQKGGNRGGRGRPTSELKRLGARFEELAEQVLAGEVDRGSAPSPGSS